MTARRIFLAGLFALVFLVNLPLVHRFVLRGEAPVSAEVPFRASFDADGLPGAPWWAAGGLWRVEGGELHAPGTRNNPLWLEAKLPPDVKISFTARAASPHGDVKVEVFGDGRDHASGYVLVFGGWKNTLSVLARLDEHGEDRLERRTPKVEPGRRYRFEVERRGSVLTWRIDGETFLELDDPEPLRGEGHDRFGFSSWQADVWFDDLAVEPL